MADSIQCPHCSAPNHGAARFCNNCGGLLAQPPAVMNVVPAVKKRPLVRWPFAVAGGIVLLLLVSGIAIAIYNANMAGNPAFSNVRPAVMGWAPEHSETRAFSPGEYVYGFQVKTYSTMKLRIDIQATSPVTVAYYNPAYEEYIRKDPAVNLKQAETQCLSQSVLRNSIECELPANGSYKLLILDERTMQSSLVGAGAAALGLKGPAEQALSRNDVTFSLSSYTCVQNCRGY